MAKKVLTPEEYTAKMNKKADKRKRFGKAFLTALAYALACVIVFAMVTIAFTKPAVSTVPTNSNNTSVNTDTNNGSTNTPADDSTPADTPADQPADTPADTPADQPADNSGSNNTADKPAGGNAAATGAISASSSTADVVKYFNTAINKVKPSAKKVTLNKEVNSSAGDMEGNLPGTLKSMANSLISSNMGEKDLSSLDADAVNATTPAAKNAMFPVENESWSSKLTPDDVQKAEVKDNGSSVTITLYIKADEPSTSTAHGQGHNGKVFSVIMPSIVTDNAGPAASIIKEVKTGHKDGKVTITVDKATGNVTAANYYFVWTLSVKALGAEISIPFGLEKQFTIAW